MTRESKMAQGYDDEPDAGLLKGMEMLSSPRRRRTIKVLGELDAPVVPLRKIIVRIGRLEYKRVTTNIYQNIHSSMVQNHLDFLVGEGIVVKANPDRDDGDPRLFRRGSQFPIYLDVLEHLEKYFGPPEREHKKWVVDPEEMVVHRIGKNSSQTIHRLASDSTEHNPQIPCFSKRGKERRLKPKKRKVLGEFAELCERCWPEVPEDPDETDD